MVIGLPLDGVVGVGMQARTLGDPPTLTVSGVEFLDGLRERKHWSALRLAEKPALDFARRAWPIDSIIVLEAGKSA